MLWVVKLVLLFGLLVPTLQKQVKDTDLVFACVTHRAGVPVAQASRAWRGNGIRAHYILDDVLELADLREQSKGFQETYSAHHDAPYYRKVQEYRFSMGPLMAHKALGDSYNWMLYGDDDTIWIPGAVKNMLEKYDPEIPYLITDNYWSNLEPGNNDLLVSVNPSKIVPRCLPCHWKRTRKQAGKPPIEAVPGCPCTPELACADINLPLSIPWNKTACIDQAYRFHAFGGAGVIFSVGLLKKLAERETEYEECVYLVRWEFGDRVLTSCLFMLGFAPTDPGLFMFDPYRPPVFGSFNNRNRGMTAVSLEARLNAVEQGRVSDTDMAVLLETVSIHVKSAKYGKNTAATQAGAIGEIRNMSKLFDKLDALREQHQRQLFTWT